MPLQFPNARLQIHDLLSIQGLSGTEAIARMALEYRLIPEEALAEVAAIPSDATCHCMAATRNVLWKYFQTKKEPSTVDVEEVWSALLREVQAYAGACPQKLEPAVQPHECSKLAPALFDILLQQLGRYP